MKLKCYSQLCLRHNNPHQSLHQNSFPCTNTLPPLFASHQSASTKGTFLYINCYTVVYSTVVDSISYTDFL